jgi:hypothetical protein
MGKVIQPYLWVIFVALMLLVMLELVGCTTTKIEYVKVPPAEPPVITRPLLDTDYLKSTDDAGTVLQAHRLVIKKLQGWGLELEAALDAYRTKDTK